MKGFEMSRGRSSFRSRGFSGASRGRGRGESSSSSRGRYFHTERSSGYVKESRSYRPRRGHSDHHSTSFRHSGRGSSESSRYSGRDSGYDRDSSYNSSSSRKKLKTSSSYSQGSNGHRNRSELASGYDRIGYARVSRGAGRGTSREDRYPSRSSYRGGSSVRSRGTGYRRSEDLVEKKKARQEWTDEYWRRVEADQVETRETKHNESTADNDKDLEDDEGGEYEDVDEGAADEAAEEDLDEITGGMDSKEEPADDEVDADHEDEPAGKSQLKEEPVQPQKTENVEIKKEETASGSESVKQEKKSQKKKETAERLSPVKEKAVLKEKDKNQMPPPSSSPSLPSPRPYIRLNCPHCWRTYGTFKEYTVHLYSERHQNSLSTVAMNLKQNLLRFRSKQRHLQRKLEEEDTERGVTLQDQSSFCQVCKLNYRQTEKQHLASELHLKIRRLLLPVCHYCQLAFKSPMLYEKHIASLEHIKRRAIKEQSHKSSGPSSTPKKSTRHSPPADKEDTEEENLDELDLEGFMTIDAVGDEDDIEDEEEEEEEKKDKKPQETPPKATPVGETFVKRVEVYHCELCHKYLPRTVPIEQALQSHLLSRSHHHEYVRYKAKTDRRRELRLKSKEQMDSKKRKRDEPEELSLEEQSTEKKAKTNEPDKIDTACESEQFADEKLWDDVDRDLGELLKEAGEADTDLDEHDDSASAKSSPSKTSLNSRAVTRSRSQSAQPEPEEANSDDEGRWDRFRNSEKQQTSVNLCNNGSQGPSVGSDFNNSSSELEITLDASV